MPQEKSSARQTALYSADAVKRKISHFATEATSTKSSHPECVGFFIRNGEGIWESKR